jgi:hypothetical protein
MLALFLALPAARAAVPPRSFQTPVQPLASLQQLVLPPTDIRAELAADEQAGGLTPLRFAVRHALTVTPATHGTWEPLPDGRLWRLRIRSAGATNLNLGFTRFWLPEGATLHVVAESEPYFQGPYTARDNKPHGQLWTAMVPGEGAVIELFVPASARQQPRLVLGQVGAGYRDLFRKQNSPPNPPAEGDCNIDVVCPQAAAWTNEIRSVGVYTINGAWTCSGTLIADVAADFRNYFLTANHCGLDSANAPSVVVYWNYQSTNCGTHGPGSLAQNQSGAAFRAAKYDVDFALLELDDIPEAGFAVYYAGWDCSGTAPAGGVGIHHPECDVKAISFSTNALTTVGSCIGPLTTNTHWQVIWTLGVTEPGSSGSGIWDPATHKLVGTLSGGGVSCADPTYPDCYGKFSVAWASGSSPADRLADWLDPQTTGVSNVPGVDPVLATILIPAGASLVSESCSPTNGAIDPRETVSVSFALHNFGGVATTNLVATLLSTGGVAWPGPPRNFGIVPSGSSVTQTFTFTAMGYCGGTIAPVLQLQDGARNLGSASFSLRLGAPTPVLVAAEDFDEAAAPALPAGWSSTVTGGGTAWATSTAQADSPPNSAFAADPPFVTDNSLVSPAIFISSAGAQLTFRHSYNVETGYDGGVLEIAINGGGFTDLLSAGGAFLTNGYNQTLSQYYQNPLAGRAAWSGNSAGFVTTTAELPATPGQSIQLRWRFGSDNSFGVVGWYVDNISVSEPGYTCCGSATPPMILNLRSVGPSGIAFSYDALAGQTYFIEARTNLGPTAWTALQTNAGDNVRQSFTNTTGASPEGFFRLRSQ